MTSAERYWLAGGTRSVPHVTRAAFRFTSEERRIVDFTVFVLNAHLVSLTSGLERVVKGAGASEGIATPAGAEPIEKQDMLPDQGFLEEMVLVRVVDSFLTYLSELLALIFEARPEMLRSSEQERLDFILQFADIDELRKALAERRVERLSYLGLRDLAKYLEDHMGFTLFRNAQDLDEAALLVELRNLLVHNRGVVSNAAVRRFPTLGPELGRRFRMGWSELRERRQFLEHAVLDIDVRATLKFKLQVMRLPQQGSRDVPDSS
jgi:hypothetical protein